MLSISLKNLSILKKFLLINLIIFIIIGSGTIIYLKTVKPNLIKKKTVNHIKIINNTIEHNQRLNIKFKEESTGKKSFVNTLNGSGLAVGRTLAALVENNIKDDTITIPKVLHDLTGFKTIKL